MKKKANTRETNIGKYWQERNNFSFVKNRNCLFLRFEQVYRGLTGHDEKKVNTRKTRVDKKEAIFHLSEFKLLHLKMLEMKKEHNASGLYILNSQFQKVRKSKSQKKIVQF